MSSSLPLPSSYERYEIPTHPDPLPPPIPTDPLSTLTLPPPSTLMI